LPTTQQENLDEDLGNDEVEVVGIGGEGTGVGEIAEAHWNSGCLEKRKRKEKTPRGEKGNKKTTRVINVIPLEEILEIKEAHLKDAASLQGISTPSQPTLKRACWEFGINIWPPCNEQKKIRQSLPIELPRL